MGIKPFVFNAIERKAYSFPLKHYIGVELYKNFLCCNFYGNLSQWEILS